ncbi:MAG: hypothetical protein JNK25_00725 [Phycisphaerae bacterium]|nr:hypothetical protein [Phycisphaerae bacterium]
MSQIATSNNAQIPYSHFEEAAKDVMINLQASMKELITALPGTIRRAVDLERALGLEKKLAWQAFRLSRGTGVGELVNIPSLASAARLSEAALARGVPSVVVEQVSAAFERFESLVADHCGDRACLLSMVSGLGYERRDRTEVRVRRAHFRSSAHLWGVQARAQVRTLIYLPDGPNGKTLEAILVSGNVGLQGMRRGEPVTISSWLSSLHKPGLGEAGHADDLGGAGPGPTPGFELLTPFCSETLPEMRHVPVRSGVMETEMVIPSAGRVGALTLYLSQRSATEGDARERGAGGGMFVSVPVEEIMIELLVPAGLTEPATARVAVYGRRHHPERVFEERRVDLLAQRESVSTFGPNDRAPGVECSPRHQEAVRFVLAKYGLTGTCFDVYRCRVKFPVLHTLVVIRVDPIRR